MSLWIYKDGRRESNPLTTDALRSLIIRGVLPRTAQIRELPNGAWQSVAESQFAVVSSIAPIKPALTKPVSSLPVRRPLFVTGYSLAKGLIGFVLAVFVLYNCFGAASFRQQEIDFARFMAIFREGKIKLSAAKNAAAKELVRDEYAKKLCDGAPGGKISGWTGSLYAVRPDLFGSDIRIEILIGALSLTSNSISKDSLMYKRIALIKASTWTKAGDPITIDGYFNNQKKFADCVEFRDGSGYYYITITNVR